MIACPPEQCTCPASGQPTEVIGYNQSEQLDVEPAKREKRACKCCEQGGVAAAPVPARTHLDAPYHFFDEGTTLDQIPLERF